MQYKKSLFNFTYTRENGEHVIYNTYSKALVVLDNEEFDQYETMNFTSEEIISELLENRILLEEDFNEAGFIRYCHNKTKYSQEALHLVLATTMDCNFGCPYCYESRRQGKMSQEVQSGILAFTKDALDSGIKSLDVTWYGGEPLLYPEIIEDMAGEFHKLVENYHCDLHMYMVTNGYLLTPDIVEMIDSIGVSKVQITLDGLKEHHDARRHLRNGKGTFDVIFENLKLFEEYSIRVDLRMNVDNENCVDYIELQKLVETLENPNIVVYPSPVEDIKPDNVNEVSQFMTYDEFEQFAGGICKEGNAASAATSVLDDRYCYCQAETENTYVIDELGNCYKCWDQVGDIKSSCFNILSQEDKNYDNILKFMDWDPFTDEKCSTCVFLPVCFGGCKFHRMNTGRYDCGFIEKSMKGYLEGTFFNY